MIETTIIDFLSENLGVFVGMEPPAETTGYVLIDKTGSSRTNHIITSTFAVQSYGASLFEALQLSKIVESKMFLMLELPEIINVELETDYNFTDTTSKQYRWQAVFDVTHY